MRIPPIYVLEFFSHASSCKKIAVAIVGGGITGVTTAYALSRRGFSVTLFERHR